MHIVVLETDRCSMFDVLLSDNSSSALDIYREEGRLHCVNHILQLLVKWRLYASPFLVSMDTIVPRGNANHLGTKGHTGVVSKPFDIASVQKLIKVVIDCIKGRCYINRADALIFSSMSV